MTEPRTEPPPTRWKKLRPVLLRWLLILTGLYFFMLVFLYFVQARIIYQPSREIEGNPGLEGMAFEEVTLATEDGLELHAWWVPALGASRGAVLFCHGNAGNISHRLDSVRIFRALGLDTLIFDYRGYGRSQGRPSERGTYLDAAAAWRHLVEERRTPPERTVVFGRSLGAAVAARLASERAPRALVLESSFSSVPDMGAHLYPYLPARMLARFEYATADHVRKVRCPVLVIHSPRDEIVPYELGRRVFESAPEPKEFLEITGSHNYGFIDSGERYTKGLGAFVEKHLNERKPRLVPVPSSSHRAGRPHKLVHVFVPLCDNENQGIVKVPAALGDGRDPKGNLYWGAAYGVRTFFSRSERWEELSGFAKPGKKIILERAVFRGKAGKKTVYVVADAYDGAHMREALGDFLAAAAGRGAVEVALGKQKLPAAGAADLVAFAGHNGLMDVRIDSFPRRAGQGGPECAVVLACKSRDYFLEPLRAAGCRPLVTTTGLMAPEAYTLDAIIRSWAGGEAPGKIREKAAAAYAKYQKCSLSAARRLFAIDPTAPGG